MRAVTKASSRRRRAIRVPFLVVPVASFAVCLAAGCSSAPSSSPVTTTSSAAPTSTTLAPIVNDPSLRQQVALSACKAVSGGWEASGEIKNTGAKAQTYEMTVYFTDSVATVIAAGETSARVEGGASGTWSVTSRFHAPSVVKCVLVGVH